jgi:Transglycosylase
MMLSNALRRLVAGAAALVATVLLVGAALAAMAWQTIGARGDEWSHRLHATLLGRTLQRDASVAVLLRLTTHPLAARAIDGRAFDTPQGRWRLGARADGGVSALCAPCRVALPALGPQPLALERVELVLHAQGADRYRGRLTVGAGPQPLAFDWHGRFDKRSGRFALDAALPTTALASAVRALAPDLPERERVRVEGTLALTASARLPDGAWTVKPQLDGFEVHGLGTERLADLQRPAACRTDAAGDLPALSGWLPRAVVAAEDQRFYEHPGYDLPALLDALASNQRPGAALAGASTITQQLAKLTVAGDERSARRKLRELLYAVEMERTLGKARILQLYLALAPWGDGVCGAERAVRVHLGQRDAAAVGPVAAAWLASLLPAPDALLHAEQAGAAIDQARVARVIEGLRPMQPERREKALATLPFWSPPGVERAREGPQAGASAP